MSNANQNFPQSPQSSSSHSRLKIWLPIIIILILLVGGYLLWSYDHSVISQTSIPPTIIGGDKDEHGCLGSAGYQWCQVKNKCLKFWEEQCGGTGQFCG